MTNSAIAAVLHETADLMEIAAMDSFRIRSYRNAATAIENHQESVAEIVRDSGRDVTEICGVGKGLKKVLEELVERGTFERREQLLELYPPTALELLKIPGLGPKSIAQIYKEFRVSSIDALEQLCRDQRLRELPRMGAKLEERVLRGVASYKLRRGRYRINFADRVAAELSAYLAEAPGVEKVTAAGSLRRGKETIGDLDLLVTGPHATAALDHFVKYQAVTEVLGRGGNKASAKVGGEGLQVDLRALDPESFGAALIYFTGSKEHNIAIRDRAVRMGLRLNEYGLYRVSDEARIAGATEAEVYEKIGLRWIPPELRENLGELRAAEENRLPALLSQADIRGDVHMHTTETDGRFSMQEMADAARSHGYRYIAITDHSKSLAMANGLDEKRLLEQIRQTRELSAKFDDFTVFSGCEVDILRDGRLDIDDEVLAQLDVVIASVHSHMGMEPREMTDRLMRVLENPHVKILGHPTGRMLLVREPYTFDFPLVAQEAARRKIRMEINASPERLDLDAVQIQSARAKGVKFVISTDAHHTRHFQNMRYGVVTARRGWLEAGDVLNTLDAEDFRKALARE